MTLTRTAGGGNATYNFQYTGTIAVIDKKADQAAHYLFDAGYGDHEKTYADLTAAEKLAILDQHVLRVILDASRTYRAQTDMDVARNSALAAEESEKIA